MRYLFVDTESSNCFNSLYKMCEYGQIVTDESFAEIEGGRKDILINPGKGGKFHLTGRKGHRDLVLAHPESEYKHAPYYYRVHHDIAFNLQEPSTMVFLWASENDIQALLDQCVRYDLPKISFVSYDVQRLFKKACPECKGTPGLDKAAAHLGIDIGDITLHRPDEDAYLTMLVLKAILEKTGKSLKELLEECPSCRVESIQAYADMLKHWAEKLEAERKKAELSPYNEELNALLSSPTPEDTPKEKKFSVSKEMKQHIDETLPLIKKWTGKGFFPRRKLDVGYLVCFDEAERDYLSGILDTSELKLILIDEFDSLVNDEE